MPPSFLLSLYHHQKHKRATPPMKNHHHHLLRHRPPPSFLPTLFHHQQAATPIKWPKNCQRLTVLGILGLMYRDGRGEMEHQGAQMTKRGFVVWALGSRCICNASHAPGVFFFFYSFTFFTYQWFFCRWQWILGCQRLQSDAPWPPTNYPRACPSPPPPSTTCLKTHCTFTESHHFFL